MRDDISAEDVINHAESFIQKASFHNPNLNKDLVKKAFEYAKKAHADKKRATGEPYFIHPIGVALILLRNRISDTASICSALLHDVVEDTETSIQTIETEFGEEVANIVEGLTKLEKNNYKHESDFNFDAYNSENLRKLILATAKDPRVMFIKLADRVDNLRTLDIFRKDKQKRIAQQTLRIYSPLAEKLGLYALKSELEDLSLLYIQPEIYSYLSKNIKLTKKERDIKTKEMTDFVRKLIQSHNIEAKVQGRAKHYYSIYSKMKKENKSLDRIYDIYGIRIITNTTEECYLIQKIISDKWEIHVDKMTGKPRIKDYIQKPKPSGYQSLHLNFKEGDSVIEVQIRTEEMDKQAEQGVAKHWKYKQHERDKKIDRKIDWIRELISWYRKPANKEHRENMLLDVFTKEIICITPKADLIIVQEGSTPLDFAYAIHSKVGDHYEKAYINNEPALMTDKLKSGDIVNIITAKKTTVSQQWLSIAQSNQAKHKIRQSLGITGKQSSPKKERTKKQEMEPILFKRVQVLGKKAPVKLSKCCNPSTDDEIVGFYTKDKKSITVHTATCPDRFSLNQKLKVPVSWESVEDKLIDIKILAEDTPGMLGQILDIISENNITIISINTKEKKKNIQVVLKVENTHNKKMPSLMKKIQLLPEVESATFGL